MTCPYCEQTHDVAPKETAICPICVDQFCTEWCLRMHLSEEHNFDPEDIEEIIGKYHANNA